MESTEEEPLLNLPRGRGHTLFRSYSNAAGLRRGIYSHNGVQVVVEVPTSSTVLFPTDFGLSLLHHTSQQWVSSPVEQMLDLGAGSGLYAIYGLLLGVGHATAMDVDPACEEVIRHNVSLNGISQDRLDFLTADINTFIPEGSFDLVTANPPHMPTVADDHPCQRDNSAALLGGEDGRDFYRPLPRILEVALTQVGAAYLDHSSLCAPITTQRALELVGLRTERLGVSELDLPMGTLSTIKRKAIFEAIGRLELPEVDITKAQEGRVDAIAMRISRQ